LTTFVDTAPQVYEMLHSLVGLNFEFTERPDYHTNIPGSKDGGRTMWPTTYDANHLADLLPLIRDTPHPGGIPPVTNGELEDSNWGIGEEGDAWLQLVEERRAGNVVSKGRALVAAMTCACAERGVEFRTETRARAGL
jgi:3-oxosteroid 1-dehydrogenase